MNFASTSRYSTLVVDPPWPFNRQPPSVKPPYATMPLDQIKRLSIADLAAADSHLYLWVPSALVADGVEILREWGFDFKTTIVWAKHQVGTGGWWRNAHELILFGVRGDLSPLRRDLRTWFMADRRQHSRKPDEFYHLVEQMSPGPRIDIFSREKREGWDQWGDQTNFFHEQVPETRGRNQTEAKVSEPIEQETKNKEDTTMNESNNEWLDARELAQHMGVSVPTVRRMTQANAIPSHKVGKRLVRYSKKEVDDHLRNGGTNGQ